jgi:hypothetical protein
VDALTGFELNVLKKEFFVRVGSGGGDTQDFAQFLQVRPQFPLALPSGFQRR